MGGTFAYPLLRDYLSSSVFQEIWLRYLVSSQRQVDSEKLKTKSLGLYFASPIGSESGLDINGVGFPKLLNAGLGFVEVGPTTPTAESSAKSPKKITSEAIIYTSAEENLGTV